MIKVICMSGGMDSTTLLYQQLEMANKPTEVYAIGFDYGQRHERELEMAALTTHQLRIPFEIVELPIGHLLASSALTGMGAIPEGMYDADNMASTVVPNRNMIMASIAVGYAESLRSSAKARGAAVYMAVHEGDHSVYPDCRKDFFTAAASAASLATDGKIQLFAPFLEMAYNKTDIFSLGCRLGVDWSMTYSCYNGKEVHCGRCGTCVERIEAVLQCQAGMDSAEYDYNGWVSTVQLLQRNGKVELALLNEAQEYFPQVRPTLSYSAKM